MQTHVQLLGAHLVSIIILSKIFRMVKIYADLQLSAVLTPTLKKKKKGTSSRKCLAYKKNTSSITDYSMS